MLQKYDFMFSTTWHYSCLFQLQIKQNDDAEQHEFQKERKRVKIETTAKTTGEKASDANVSYSTIVENRIMLLNENILKCISL